MPKAKDRQALYLSTAPLVRVDTQLCDKPVDKSECLRLSEGKKLHEVLQQPTTEEISCSESTESHSEIVKDKEGEEVEVSRTLYRVLTAGRS
jgi:hypothetical protein